MAKFNFFNIGKANAFIDEANVAADAALTAAKISTIKVDGKDVSAYEAPLAAKINALSALAATGDKTQDVAELIATNGQIAAQVETLTNANSTLTATTGAQAQKISQLESDLAASNASVQALTSEKASLTNQLSASNGEVQRLVKDANAINTEISRQCVAVNCLTLNGEDGKPLAKDATQENKVAAADKLPVSQKLTSLMGAVHSAAAKIGVDVKDTPASTAANPNAPKLSATERCKQAVIESKKNGTWSGPGE